MSLPRTLQRTLVLFALAMLAVPASGQVSAPKHWELGFTTTDADTSPDDRLLAVTVESPSTPQRPREPIVESVEIWDYRQKIKIGNTRLATYPNSMPTSNTVRFTADGLFLIASEPTKVHVLDAATLNSLRVIEPPLDQGFRINKLETSPSGHVAIVAANGFPNSAVLFAYDLDSGRLLFQWKSPHQVTSVSWKLDGTEFAVAAPFPCTWFRDTIHVFSVNPWLHLETLKARNPTSVAFSEDRLYFVESGFCKGSMFDRHLGLESFDINGWHRLQTVLLPNRDIHSFVSFANGRLLAGTGNVKIQHDWLDGTTWGVETYLQFTTWEGDARSIIFSSVPVAGRTFDGDTARLSRTGKTVLLNPRNPQVFQVP